jgi:hypothetical protein
MRKKHGMKNTSKANKKSNPSLAEKTEQILLTMPRIIALQISKDLTVLKQQENKLKNDHQKASSHHRKMMDNMRVLKTKNTPSAKKQMQALQKKTLKASQEVNMYVRALEALGKQAQALTQKKEKYSALQMQLMKFQKEWAKKPQKPAASSKKSKIKAKSMKPARKSAEPWPQKETRDNSFMGAEVMEVIELPDQRESMLIQESNDKVI